MLRPDCRRFREEFTPGTESRNPSRNQDSHRWSCPSCDAFAEAMERAASAPKLALPSRLRGELRGLPSFVQHDAPRLPFPQAPLPPGLKNSLRGIARRARSEPPLWVRSSRYAVAASYFLAVVLTYAMGDPAELTRRATDTLSQTGHTWTRSVGQRYGAAVGSLESSLESSLAGLRSEVREITEKLTPEASNHKEKP